MTGTTMTIICAWCGKHLGDKEGGGESGTTHTICDECSKQELDKYMKSKEITNAGSK